ncbi:hypothetical protein COU79_04830 [Candidatus Peregrinibacteria bacterium CG10_big_fil_rev_8_21_14_0_10_54_7]|nr:MAG: hypothetical protein COU79_04830 [Candidatus Peregrinibacteria bacterium CG10_big_fil_rev_8_21_14_0_10_54_7]
MLLQLQKLWPINRKSCLLMFITTFSSVVVHLVWGAYPGEYLGSLVWSSWAFVWLPVVVSYLMSGLISTAEFRSFFNGKNFNISAYQRYVSLLIGGILNIAYSNIFENMETGTWIFLAYVFLVFPIQLVMVLVTELTLFLTRKYG